MWEKRAFRSHFSPQARRRWSPRLSVLSYRAGEGQWYINQKVAKLVALAMTVNGVLASRLEASPSLQLSGVDAAWSTGELRTRPLEVGAAPANWLNGEEWLAV